MILLAPNGKPSNLTKEQYFIVRTPEFKQWFGDWEKLELTKINDSGIDEISLKRLQEDVSKVVDENGEPLVVYHGTYVENPFYIFDFDKADIGFHFGTYEQAKNRSETKLFFKGHKSIVNQFFLNIKKIYQVSDIGEWEYPQRYLDMFMSDNIITEIEFKKNGFEFLNYKEDNKQIRDFLIEKYNKKIGFEYNNKYEGEGKSYIVVEPNQIKLADGTNSTFDGNNSDIRFEEGGEVNNFDVLNSEYYEKGGTTNSCESFDENGERKIDPVSIKNLTECILKLPQTKKMNIDNEGNYTKERQDLHIQIMNNFKKDLVCIDNDNPIAILMGGSPASGKSTFLKKYRPFLLNSELLKIDADEIRAKLPEYKGFNATQTQEETKDIVNTLLSDKTIGIPCDFDIVYDGTMNSVKSYLPLIELLKKRGYKIYVIYIDNVDYDVVLNRMLSRYQKSGRFVPVEVIDDFFSKGKQALNIIKQEADGYLIVDGSTNDYNILEKGGIELPDNRLYSKLGKPIKELNQFDQNSKQTTLTDANNDDIRFEDGGKIDENVYSDSLKIIIKNVKKENKYKGAYKRIFEIIEEDITFYNPYGTIYEELNGTDFKIEITPIPDEYIIEKIRKINNVEIVNNFKTNGTNTTFDPNNDDIRFEKGGNIFDKFLETGKIIDDEDILKKYDLNSFVLQNKYQIAHLDKIVAQQKNEGVGTKTMNDLVDWADENDITVALTPSTSFGATSVNRLKDFYKKFGFVENKGRNKIWNTTASMIREPKRLKGGRTIAQTPAVKSEQISGSDVNKKGSSKDLKNATKIEFSDKTLVSIINKVNEHNKKHPNKKITVESAKAVVRRGMGAYSKSHRPTISNGKPNSRVAWGLARLNAFIYKIVNGKSKSGKYIQDDDLINELKMKNQKFQTGGDVPKSNKMFHLPLELVVYVPSTKDVDKIISKQEMKERVDEVKNFLGKSFGGYSSVKVEGGYVANDGDLVNENITKVVSFASKDDYEKNKNELVAKMTHWSEKWGQEAIGFEFEGDLYYVPEKLAKGGKISHPTFHKLQEKMLMKKGGGFYEGWGFNDTVKILLKGTKSNITKTFKELSIIFPREDKDIIEEKTIEIFIDEKDLRKVKKIANYNNLTILYEVGGEIDYSEGWNNDYENDPIVKAQKKAKELAIRGAAAYATAGSSEVARAQGQAIQGMSNQMQTQPNQTGQTDQNQMLMQMAQSGVFGKMGQGGIIDYDKSRNKILVGLKTNLLKNMKERYKFIEDENNIYFFDENNNHFGTLFDKGTKFQELRNNGNLTEYGWLIDKTKMEQGGLINNPISYLKGGKDNQLEPQELKSLETAFSRLADKEREIKFNKGGKIGNNSIQHFVNEVKSLSKHSKLIKNTENLNITSKNNLDFEKLLTKWKKGMYDNDMDSLVSELNLIISEQQEKLNRIAIEEQKTDYVNFSYMDWYNDGYSSIKIKGDEKTLTEIQTQHLPELLVLLDKKFKKNKFSSNESFLKVFLDKFINSKKYYYLTIFPLGWLIEGYGEDDKFIVFIKQWFVKLCEKFDFKIENKK